MDFFDSFPDPPPPPEPPRVLPRPSWMKPVAALPTTVAENALIVHDERLAIAIGSLSVYPNGFEFTIHVRSRGERDQIDPFGRRRYRDYLRNSSRTELEDPSENLRVGILFADGRRAASNQPRHHLPLDQERDPDEVVIQLGSGGGSATHWDTSYWVHPLPQEGPLTIVMSWLAQGITEVRHEVDGAAVRAAAERAVQLWPEQPPGE